MSSFLVTRVSCKFVWKLNWEWFWY